MEAYSLQQFLDRLKVDDALRQRVADAERAASSNMKRDMDVITQIAAEAGYDITGWSSRPRPLFTPADEELGDSCPLTTCCLAFTSTLSG